MGQQDASFQGIDPGQLAELMNSLSGGVSRAQPLAQSYLAEFRQLDVSTSGVQRLLSDFEWASSQQPMLSRRHELASQQPPGNFKDGMTSAGAGALAFTTSAAASKAGTAAAQKLAAALAAGDDSAAEQQLAALAENGDDPDYANAFTNWANQHEPDLLTIGQSGYLAYSALLKKGLSAWNKLPETLWSSPGVLHDHAFGGPSRPGGPPHAPDFGAGSEEEYAKLAYQFLQQANANGYEVKVTKDALRLFDPATKTFASYGLDGTAKTFFKPTDGAAYWNKPANGPAGTPADIDVVAGNAATNIDAEASVWARAGRLLDTPVGRAGGRALGALGATGDVLTIADPSPDALGGADTERTMAAANLGAMAITAGPGAAVLAANGLDWVPGVGEVVMVGTVAYFAGDLIYENRKAIGHALSSAGHATVSVAKDIGHGVSHVWHSIFG